MSLRDKLQTVSTESVPVLSPRATPIDYAAHYELKKRVHQKLLDRVDLAVMESLSPERLRQEIKILVERLLNEETVVINDAERKSLVRDIQHEMLGLGPLEPLLADPTISDILVNTYQQVFVERHGRLELTSTRFSDDAHLLKIIDKIVSRVGRRIDESSPMVDARLPDGSRVNAIIPPVAVDGPMLSIRRFAVTPLKMQDILQFKSLTPEMATILE
ncbi:MAG: ATPase, T2SS/T4P/T4SS family, partial [Burkholderiales bacterium]